MNILFSCKLKFRGKKKNDVGNLHILKMKSIAFIKYFLNVHILNSTLEILFTADLRVIPLEKLKKYRYYTRKYEFYSLVCAKIYNRLR